MATRTPRTSSTSTTAGSGSSTSASPAGSPTRTCPASRGCSSTPRPRTSSALPRRLADLGVRYPREREDELRSRARGALLPLLRRAALGDRPDRGDPGRARPDLLDEPAAADAVRDPRQDDRHPRLGRGRGLSGLQRVRGREARTQGGSSPSGSRPGGSRSALAARRRSSARSRSTCPDSSTPCSRSSRTASFS